jgi:hypothetical protein
MAGMQRSFTHPEDMTASFFKLTPAARLNNQSIAP